MTGATDPLPLNHESLNLPISYVPDGFQRMPDNVGIHRFIQPHHIRYLQIQYGEGYNNSHDPDYFNFKERWNWLPAKLMLQAFDFNELTQLWFHAVISSELSEHFEKNDPYTVLYKTKNAVWHWSIGQENYNMFVYFYHRLKSFRFDIPDTEVFFDHATYHNSHGWSKYQRTYIDAPFGYLIYYKGKHVLTIGFAPSCHGLLINQIQLKQPKGNRWLYKLPGHYFEYCITKMAETFHDTAIWLPQGNSMAGFVKKQYHKDDGHLFTQEKFEHVARVYNSPLTRWERTSNTETKNGIEYTRLHDTTEQLCQGWFDPEMNYKTHPSRSFAA